MRRRHTKTRNSPRKTYRVDPRGDWERTNLIGVTTPFRGRYRAVLVDADQHLLEVLRYIQRNPLRAGLAEALGDYRRSSHQGYAAGARKWD